MLWSVIILIKKLGMLIKVNCTKKFVPEVSRKNGKNLREMSPNFMH